MNPDIIKSAGKKLKLLDIVIHDSRFSRNSAFDPLSYPVKFIQQASVGGKSELVVYENGSKKADRIFRNFITFAIKATTEKNEDEGTKEEELFIIEATFRLDYSILVDLDEKEAIEFSRFNTTHNAWPFWRQFVFQTVNDAHLPKLDVPLMLGIEITEPTSKKMASKKTRKKTKKKNN